MDGSEDRLTASSPKVFLRAQQIQNFALALRELTTDAVKYGALSSDTGRFAISWDVLLDRSQRPQLEFN